jgi:hypothetical protein
MVDEMSFRYDLWTFLVCAGCSEMKNGLPAGARIKALQAT